MHFSFSTLLLAVLYTNIGIILLAFLFQNKKIVIKTGYPLLLWIVFFTIIRFILPIEFIFTQSIPMPPVISEYIGYYRCPILFDHRLSLWNITEIVWLSVFISKFVKHIISYQDMKKEIGKIGTDVTDKYKGIIDAVLEKKKRRHRNLRKVHFQIKELEDVTSPMIYGVLHPCIILPTSLQLDERELSFIFAHEIAHYDNYDIYLKHFIRMICLLYWWNPLCSILERQLDILLEMRVDEQLIKQNPERRVPYAECIVKVIRQMGDQKNRYLSAIAFGDNTNEFVRIRIQMLVHQEQRPGGMKKGVLFAASCLFFLMSYLFIMENSFTPYTVAQEFDANTSENTVIYENSDGTYDVYFYDEYLETTKSLEYYPESIPIIERGIEQNENWKIFDICSNWIHGS